MTEVNGQSPHHRADIEVAIKGDKVTLRTQDNLVMLSSDEAQELASRIFEMAARANGEDPEEHDWKRLPMQYLHLAIEALPADGGEKDDELETGAVRCWIKDQTQRNARHVAAGWIAENGWGVIEEFEQRVVSRADFADTDFLRYYEQALIDDEVFVFEHDGQDNEDESEETADER